MLGFGNGIWFQFTGVFGCQNRWISILWECHDSLILRFYNSFNGWKVGANSIQIFSFVC